MATYITPQRVTLYVVTPTGARIYYTTNDVDPTESSTLYNPASPIYVTSSIILKARAFAAGYDPSAITRDVMDITLNRVYYGYSTLTTLTGAQVLALSNSPYVNSVSTANSFGTYVIGSGATATNYFYFWWPDSFTMPTITNGFLNTNGGFPVAMAETSLGYTSGPTNGWYWLPVTVSGLTGKLFRTYYQVGNGTDLTIRVQ